MEVVGVERVGCSEDVAVDRQVRQGSIGGYKGEGGAWFEAGEGRIMDEELATEGRERGDVLAAHGAVSDDR